jgi:Protein of unknown function (DUF2971)
MTEIIYHVTDTAGLNGIFSTGKLWCTHIYYLNDALEYRHTRQLYREALQESISRVVTQNEAMQMTYRAITEAEKYDYLDQRFFPSPRHYVTCFSERQDDLPLWRGYADGGPRFSIGFRRDQLERLWASQGVRLGQVRYDTDNVKSEITHLYAQEVNRIASQSPRSDGHVFDPFCNISHLGVSEINERIINRYVPLVKHRKFSAETEWRLYSDSDNQGTFLLSHEIKVRAGKTFLIPYVELDLTGLDSPISSICVGPSPHQNETLGALNVWLIQRTHRSPPSIISGQSSIQFHCSDIPYRDW